MSLSEQKLPPMVSDELGHQLAHDCSNFLYTLGLKIQLLEARPMQPLDWSRVKEDSARLIALLEQWQNYHDRPTTQAKVDLNELVRQAAAVFDGESRIEVKFSPVPLWLT